MIRIILIIFVILAGSIGTIGADSEYSGHGETVEGVLSEIRAELGLGENQPIDPDKVSPRFLEELGEAVMATMHPDAEQHEWMDRMMGGEGSDSLADAHRWIGYRYLSGGYGRGYGMMGGGMMGPGMMNRWGMMGDPRVPYGSVPAESPEDIVKRRYAEGEISREEYLQILEDLRDAESAHRE